MTVNNKASAEKYYTLVGQKDGEGIKKFLHSEVDFISPLASLKGKKAVVEATQGFMKGLKSLKIRVVFSSGDQAMVVYDSDIPGFADNFPGASLLTFREGLIDKIELFHDASRFVGSMEA